MELLEPCGLEATGECCDGWLTATQEQRDRASAVAAYFIWGATGRQYGLCERIVRPCGETCNNYSTYHGPLSQEFRPMLTSNGEWINCRGGSCGCNPCNCCDICAIPLPGRVDSIVEVKLDGVILDPSEYFVYDYERLVKAVGCFPSCQDLQLPTTEIGTFEVTYMQGTPLPLAGQAALDKLACQYLSLCGGGECGLPERWQSISREGVSISALDAILLSERGRTGIWEIDSWINIVNPRGVMYPPYIPAMDGRSKVRIRTS